MPPFAIAVGVPAKVLRYRFAEDIREKLLQLAWWGWSRDRLVDALMDFRHLGVEDFLAKYLDHGAAPAS